MPFVSFTAQKFQVEEQVEEETEGVTLSKWLYI